MGFGGGIGTVQINGAHRPRGKAILDGQGFGFEAERCVRQGGDGRRSGENEKILQRFADLVSGRP